MRFLTTLASLACVSFAAGAVAKTYTPQNADKYAEERGFQGLDDPADQAAAEIQARDAEPDALADAAKGWFAGAHGGKAAAPAYKGFAHKHGHFVREAMPMPEVDGAVGDVPEVDDEVDMSLEGYEEAHQALVARSAEPELEGLEGVDTSLEGFEVEGDDDEDGEDDEDDEPSLHARDVQEGEEDEDDEEPAYVDDDDDDLQGPDHELVARSLEGEGVDTSLEGYGDLDEADADNNGDDDDDDDEASIHARSVPFRKQGWTKPNMASAVKSAWGSYATKGGARKVSSHHPGHQHLPHHAREADPKPEAEADPEAKGRGHHAGHKHASHTSRPGKPSGAQTSWAHKPSGTKKAGKAGWGVPVVGR